MHRTVAVELLPMDIRKPQTSSPSSTRKDPPGDPGTAEPEDQVAILRHAAMPQRIDRLHLDEDAERSLGHVPHAFRRARIDVNVAIPADVEARVQAGDLVVR
jgi:hypothetical protein